MTGHYLSVISAEDRHNKRQKCGQQTASLQEQHDFGSNPGELRMWMYLPSILAANAPLVVVLHGCSQTAHSYAGGAGWLELADRYGFAVLAPEQKRSNNAYLSFNWFEHSDCTRDRGEAASISQMVSFAIALLGADAGRVFVTGLSSGGAMTAVMLATYPEVFAGGALLAGLPYGSAGNAWEALRFMSRGDARTGTEWGDKVRDASSNRGPWPCVSIWHGEQDTTVRPSAGEDLVSQWTNVHGVDGEAVQAKTDDGRSYRVWHSSTGAALVQHHSIAQLAHGAPIKTRGPAGCGREGPYLLEHGISSSLEIAASWGIA